MSSFRGEHVYQVFKNGNLYPVVFASQRALALNMGNINPQTLSNHLKHGGTYKNERKGLFIQKCIFIKNKPRGNQSKQ